MPSCPALQELGPNRDYNIDLAPKFMMANGKLVRVLLHTDVVKYLEFKAVDGSYVSQLRGKSRVCLDGSYMSQPHLVHPTGKSRLGHLRCRCF